MRWYIQDLELSPTLLVSPIWKRLHIGVGFEHKVLVWTWPKMCEWHLDYYICVWWMGMFYRSALQLDRAHDAETRWTAGQSRLICLSFSLFVNSVKPRLIHLWVALCACPEPIWIAQQIAWVDGAHYKLICLPSHEHVPCLIVLKVKANLYKVCTI